MRGGESRDLQKQSPDIYLRIWKSDIKWKWPPNVTLTFSFKIRVQHTRTISLTLQWRKQLRGTLSYCIIFFGPFEKRLIPKFVVIAHVSFHTLHIAMKTLEIFFMGRMDRDKPHIRIPHSSSRRVTPPTRIPLWVLFLIDDEHFRFGPAIRSTQYIPTWNVYKLLVLGAEIKNTRICARWCHTLRGFIFSGNRVELGVFLDSSYKHIWYRAIGEFFANSYPQMRLTPCVWYFDLRVPRRPTHKYVIYFQKSWFPQTWCFCENPEFSNESWEVS